MRHVQALSKGQLQYLVSLSNRFIYHVHVEFAGVVGEFFKFQDLKLDTKGRVLHFKRLGDFPVRTKLVNYPISLKYHEFSPNRKITRTFEMQNTPFGVQLEVLEFEKLTDDTSKLNMH